MVKGRVAEKSAAVQTHSHHSTAKKQGQIGSSRARKQGQIGTFTAG